MLFNAIKFYLPSNSFYMPLKRLGNLKRMRAINVFPEVVLREGIDSSVLEFRIVLLAADHQERPCYISLIFLKNVSL